MGFFLNKVKFDHSWEVDSAERASAQNAATQTNASPESPEEYSPSRIALYAAVFTYPPSNPPKTSPASLCIISTSTSPPVITSSTVRKFYPSLPRLTCIPTFPPTHTLSTHSMLPSTSFVNLPLVSKGVNRDRVEMKYRVFVVESDEEGIVLSVDFLRKERLDLRWSEGLGGTDCLVKAERGKEKKIPFFLQWRQ
jgi:hypothetical protein